MKRISRFINLYLLRPFFPIKIQCLLHQGKLTQTISLIIFWARQNWVSIETWNLGRHISCDEQTIVCQGRLTSGQANKLFWVNSPPEIVYKKF